MRGFLYFAKLFWDSLGGAALKCFSICRRYASKSNGKMMALPSSSPLCCSLNRLKRVKHLLCSREVYVFWFLPHGLSWSIYNYISQDLKASGNLTGSSEDIRRDHKTFESPWVPCIFFQHLSLRFSFEKKRSLGGRGLEDFRQKLRAERQMRGEHAYALEKESTNCIFFNGFYSFLKVFSCFCNRFSRVLIGFAQVFTGLLRDYRSFCSLFFCQIGCSS